MLSVSSVALSTLSFVNSSLLNNNPLGELGEGVLSMATKLESL
jgi:hypothetical protein